mmetsp:Transcript_46932/g.135704  ORF Transcript_46932/g.135704 Transcript_46932/m.135704 type:complete len:370 (+) Transcript_46932:38-1147(+)
MGVRSGQFSCCGESSMLLQWVILAILPSIGMSGHSAGIAGTSAATTTTTSTLPRFRGTVAPAKERDIAVDIHTGATSSVGASSIGAATTTTTSQRQTTASNATAPNATRSNTSAPQQPQHAPWVEGTWTTGYWDCCKPSCAWPGKGNVDKPMLACDARTGNVLSDSGERSVCDGGSAGSCQKHQPFLAHANLALGFAAAAVSGNHGLTGDDNCGQCYELRFLNKMHDGGVWGGAHPLLVNKTMVVQVTNIGQDVTGAHSFDIQIPGAGQGIFSNGCAAQYPGFAIGDFDCDNRYGGCTMKEGCRRLPKDLQPGCEWRHDWFRWFHQGGQTNNPWIKFRRVRCPQELTAISGSTPLDDQLYQAIDPAHYF